MKWLKTFAVALGVMTGTTLLLLGIVLLIRWAPNPVVGFLIMLVLGAAGVATIICTCNDGPL